MASAALAENVPELLAVAVAIRVEPSKMATDTLALAVPATTTVPLVVEVPLDGEVIEGATGTTVTETAALAALVWPFTVWVAVSE